jgi:hypothetical protein
MPRRNRRRDDDPPRPQPTTRSNDAPIDYQLPGYEVRFHMGDRGYTCPGCEHPVVPNVRHVVVVPTDDADRRRHWHTRCWEIELRRLRGRRG